MGSLIILDHQKPKNHNKTYIWRSEWLQPFESPWGVLEKFRFANEANEEDIFRIFSGYPEGNTNYGHFRSLITLTGINGKVSESLLGIDIKALNKGYLQRIIGALPVRNIENYVRRTLSFCPECIKEGHHSLFHQIKLFTKCPYHDVSLQQRCPKCHSQIPYKLSFDWSTAAFKCKCGYSFINSEMKHNFIDKWYNRPASKIVIPEISKWINMVREDHNKLRKVYFNPAAIYHEDIIKYVLHVIQPSNTYNNNEIHNVQRAPAHFSVLKYRDNQSKADKQDDMRKLNKELAVYARSIYKAVARYIRKHILKKHKKCIQIFTRKMEGEDICPLAFAYVMWRRDLEGLRNYWQVDRCWKMVKRKYDDYQDVISLYNSTNNFVGQYLFNGNYKFTDKKQQEMKWVYGRIAWLAMLYHFVKWTRVAEECSKKRMFYHQLPLEDKDMPFHLTILEDNKNKPAEFHWWVQAGYLEHIDNINCPYH